MDTFRPIVTVVVTNDEKNGTYFGIGQLFLILFGIAWPTFLDFICYWPTFLDFMWYCMANFS